MDSSSRKIRVGVLGLGKHARNKILPAIDSLRDRLEVTALCTRNASVLAEVGAGYEAARFTDSAAFLKSDFVDVVYIAVPQSLHEESAIDALAAGKHVWCEKCLASDRHGWQRLSVHARHTGLALCETWQFPYHPQFLGLAGFLTSGRLGRLREAEAVFTVPHFPDRTNIRYRKDLGGGAFFDLACYTIRMAGLIAGVHPRSIQARVQQPRDFDVDTAGEATLEYGDGAVFRLKWGFGFDYTNQVRLVGEHGSLTLPFAFTKSPTQETAMTWQPHAGGEEVTVFRPADPFAEMLKVYSEAIASLDTRKQQWRIIDEHGALFVAVQDAVTPATA